MNKNIYKNMVTGMTTIMSMDIPMEAQTSRRLLPRKCWPCWNTCWDITGTMPSLRREGAELLRAAVEDFTRGNEKIARVVSELKGE